MSDVIVNWIILHGVLMAFGGGGFVWFRYGINRLSPRGKLVVSLSLLSLATAVCILLFVLSPMFEQMQKESEKPCPSPAPTFVDSSQQPAAAH